MTDDTNFFDDLERELVAATSDRGRRLRRARTRRAAGVTTIAVAVLAAGGGLAAALTTSDTTNNSAAPATATTTPTVNGDRLVPALPKPGSFTVAVLNGTTIPGLGRGVATRLAIGKHKIGVVTNAASQDVTATRVFYVPGGRAAAAEVAHGLEVAPDAIQPATPGVRVIAGDQARVIVLAGSDQNTTPRRSH